MVVDASDVCFHPDGDQFLAGFSIPEEAPGFDFDCDGNEFFEEYIWPRLAHRSSSFERCGHLRGWFGLYVVTPDCSGIAGPVPGIANLFEAHSFTGRGVMQSFGVACALSERIVEGRYQTCDLSPLGRERFETREGWLPETLHIEVIVRRIVGGHAAFHTHRVPGVIKSNRAAQSRSRTLVGPLNRGTRFSRATGARLQDVSF